MDNRSTIDIFYHNTFIKIGFKNSNLKPITTLLYAFTDDFIIQQGIITLPLSLGDFPRIATIIVDFLVEYLSTFNAVLQRQSLKALKAITPFLMEIRQSQSLVEPCKSYFLHYFFINLKIIIMFFYSKILL